MLHTMQNLQLKILSIHFCLGFLILLTIRNFVAENVPNHKIYQDQSLETILLKLLTESQNLLKSICQRTLFCGQYRSESGL